MPTANQYVSLHEVYVAKIPASNLPWTTPRIKPERVVDIALARILEGARSADQGIQICGVTCKHESISSVERRTVVTPIKKDNPCNIATDLASASPIDKREQAKTRRMTRGLRRTRSPSGEINNIPVA